MIQKYIFLRHSLHNITLILLGFLILHACGNRSLKVDVSGIEVDVATKEFDRALFTSDTSVWESSFHQLLLDYPPFFESENRSEMWRMRRVDEDLNELYDEVQSNREALMNAIQGLEGGLKHYYYYFPDREVSTVYTYVSGLDLDYPVIYADTMIFLASDLFLGSENSLYRGMPSYITKGLDAQYALKEIFREISRFHIPNNPQDKSLLNRMIYEGKRMYFVEAMLPEMTDSLLMGYSAEHIQWAEENEAYIWAHLVGNKYLFGTDQDLMGRFMEPAPFTKFFADIDPKTPGRLGVWMGWQIVRSYMEEHDEMGLIEMINTLNAQEILNQSNYKPKR